MWGCKELTSKLPIICGKKKTNKQTRHDDGK